MKTIGEYLRELGRRGGTTTGERMSKHQRIERARTTGKARAAKAAKTKKGGSK